MISLRLLGPSFSDSFPIEHLLYFALGSFVLVFILLNYYNSIAQKEKSTNTVFQEVNPLLLDEPIRDIKSKNRLLIKIVVFILIFIIAFTPFSKLIYKAIFF